MEPFTCSHRGPDMDTGVPTGPTVAMGTRLEAGLGLCWWGGEKGPLIGSPTKNLPKQMFFFQKNTSLWNCRELYIHYIQYS